MEKYPITEHWFKPGVKQVTKEWTLQDDFKFLPEDALDFLVDVLVISAWIIPLLMAGITSSTSILLAEETLPSTCDKTTDSGNDNRVG